MSTGSQRSTHAGSVNPTARTSGRARKPRPLKVQRVIRTHVRKAAVRHVAVARRRKH